MSRPSLSNESEIILRAQDGDPEAFTKLVKLFNFRIESLILAKSFNACMAQEIAQITWIKVWKKIKTFKGQSSFLTWCSRIAINAFYDERRKTSRIVSIEAFKRLGYKSIEDFSYNAFYEKLIDKESPDLILDEEEERARKIEKIKRLISFLDESKRKTVELVLIQGLSYKEAAKEQKVPVGTIMSRLHYAKKRMQRADVQKF